MLNVIVSHAEVNTLSTGVGIDERGAEHSEYTLKLVFFVDSGAYLANINVTIFDQDGNKILETVSNGPWLYVNLKEGEYKVTAVRTNGDSQSTDFSVFEHRQQIIALMFPDR
jgi:hypothetical protein